LHLCLCQGDLLHRRLRLLDRLGEVLEGLDYWDLLLGSLEEVGALVSGGAGEVAFFTGMGARLRLAGD
jgi:hypothetical protein